MIGNKDAVNNMFKRNAKRRFSGYRKWFWVKVYRRERENWEAVLEAQLLGMLTTKTRGSNWSEFFDHMLSEIDEDKANVCVIDFKVSRIDALGR